MQSVGTGGAFDTFESVGSPAKQGPSDTSTLSQGGYSEVSLTESLDASRVNELAKWWRRQIKLHLEELSPALAEDQTRKELREVLVEMVQESALDTEIGRVVKAANKARARGQ